MNLRLDLDADARLDACLDEGVRIVSLFWGDPLKLAPRAKAGGAMVMQTVRSADEARRAVDLRRRHSRCARLGGGRPRLGNSRDDGPGSSRGGCSRTCSRGVRRVASPMAEGWPLHSLLAPMVCGSAPGFSPVPRANFHAHYRKRLLAASETDTVYLENLFDGGPWKDAPARVLRNKTVAAWRLLGVHQ